MTMTLDSTANVFAGFLLLFKRSERRFHASITSVMTFGSTSAHTFVQRYRQRPGAGLLRLRYYTAADYISRLFSTW